MRKKYLSALLFGALIFASAGTFTSCKDYDDDISNLQNQITANADAIKALQDKINAGKWVTEVAPVEGGFKITFSDGQSFEIVNGKDGANGADGANGTKITIGEDGYWYFDGVKSEYKAVCDNETSKTKAPYVNPEDGYWYFYNEAGEAVKSPYKAVGAAYAVEANGGYNLYMPNEKGEMGEPIFVPGAAAAITSIEAEDGNIAIEKYVFSQENKETWKKLTGKTITSNKYILTSATEIDVRINPVNVQATGIDFSLTNSKNETLPGVVFGATEYKEYLTRADFGNGLYTLKMNRLEVADDKALENFKVAHEGNNILYALNAENAARGKYQFTVGIADGTKAITSYLVDDKEVVGSVVSDLMGKVAHTVSVKEESALYDMWLTAAEEDVNLFKLSFDQEKHTFTVNADPDVITKAEFTLTVHTLNVKGEYATKDITVKVSNEISTPAEYAKRTLNIVENKAQGDKNFFTADMATMTDAMEGQLDVWKKKVSSYDVVYFADAECKDEDKVSDATNSGIKLDFVGKDGKPVAIKEAVDMKFAVNNTTASGLFQVDKVYYAEVTFTDADGNKLNSVVIPFEFKIPTLASAFEIKGAYVENGVINAYFYQAGTTAVELDKYFSKFVKDATVKFADGKIGETNKTGEDLFNLINPTAFESASLNFDDIRGGIDNNGQGQNGYGEVVTINVEKGDYLGWKYQAKDADKYSFKIRLMSPIYEGSIVPAEGDVITINGNDLVKGADITDKQIVGKDYNGNAYNVVADKASDIPAWANPQIKNVSAAADKDKYIKEVKLTAATKNDKGQTVNGTINVKGESISQTVTVEMPVTVEDAWGYKLTQEVSVKIVKN